MGWNEVEIKEDQNNLIFDKHEKNYYFVHSYYFDCIEPENKIAVSNYGIEFTSIVSKENIFGVQFHPEKSSTQGLAILKNFIKQ